MSLGGTLGEKLVVLGYRSFWGTLRALTPTLYEQGKDRYERVKSTLGVYSSYPAYFNRSRSIFIHIPKAAGSSISMSLYGRPIDHRTWRYWDELNPRKFKEYFKFAVVRDPVSRFVSAFYYLKDGGVCESDKHFGEEVLGPFAHPDELARALLDPVLLDTILGWGHFCPQSTFVADEEGRSVMDLLIPFEKVDVGFEMVTRRLGLSGRRLSRLNEGRAVRSYQVSPRTREMIECLYRDDVALWEQARRAVS